MNNRKNMVISNCTIEYYQVLFADYLKYQRGLSLDYRKRLCKMAQLFLQTHSGSEIIDFSRITAKYVIDFISNIANHKSPHRTQNIACYLRTILKFLHLKNFISSDLSRAIPRVAVWKLDGVPEYLTKKEIELVLKNCDRKKIKGLRDYAIIRIISSLGLRAFEVAQLTLDDIDWENGEITIKGKGLQSSQLPLMQDLGEDLVAYLVQGRPSCPSRSLFLSAFQPFHGLTSKTISTIVGHAFARADIHKKGKAHLIRHSLASFLLNSGASLQEVGDVLRHKSINTTAIYAKVDFKRLESLALPWPVNLNIGGVL